MRACILFTERLHFQMTYAFIIKGYVVYMCMYACFCADRVAYCVCMYIRIRSIFGIFEVSLEKWAQLHIENYIHKVIIFTVRFLPVWIFQRGIFACNNILSKRATYDKLCKAFVRGLVYFSPLKIIYLTLGDMDYRLFHLWRPPPPT